ncbi:MAG: N-acetylmuramoyl-L-alanine amidase [Chloroflexi bacterium]|nr:N-acetylmuramoyl-L-alanine amidase [Chloroflexota bacterium]
MSGDPSDFKPLPRRNGKVQPRKRQAVGASTPSAPRRSGRSRSPAAPVEDAAPAPRARRASRKTERNPFGWLKYAAFSMVVGIGIYVFANMQPLPPAAPPAEFTPDPDATLVPTEAPFFIFPKFPELPTPAPTPKPTPSVPDAAIVAGHWAPESGDSVPAVRDSGAICPDGLREVDINKSVADKTVALLERKGYRVQLLQEFDPVYKDVNPDFAPRAFLSIHADSCLQGADYAYATGYKIAHAAPSDNEQQDERLVTCLTRSYDKVAAKYDKPFNANTITRNMTEYHGFRKIDPTTPAAIIELGFLGHDREFLVNHQDEMAQGIARGLDDFLKGQTCLPPTATPPRRETTRP